jgi:hypothetical protein
MSYFFPITADIVAGKVAGHHPGDVGDMATPHAVSAARRTGTNSDCRQVATVASLPALQLAAADWREYFEERAAIREHDGRLSRRDAEAGALADLAAHWLALNPLPVSTDAACVHCGGAGPEMPVLAAGGHAWLHRACWAPMNGERGAQAAAMVRALLETAP